MENRIGAATMRQFAVLSSIAWVCTLAVACSSKGGESTVHGAAPGTTGTGGPTTLPGGGSGANGGGLMLGPVDQTPNKGPCHGLECQVQTCANGAKTTISGKVYDPAGKVPLYNVAVYVPNAPVMPFTEGASCDRCGSAILNPVTAAVTDEAGAFVLQDAPVGQNIPLVIQVGKWRRQITLPAVSACMDNALTDPQVTRLPRNKAEGDIPKIAISVGGADQMECLPLRMGIDPAEFTNASGDGRIHLYVGHNGGGGGGLGGGGRTQGTPVTQFDAAHGGGMLTSSADLWASKDSLMKYDITILSCEGGANEREKPMSARQAMYDYASAGGRVFASHWHNVWFAQGPQPLPATGTWSDRREPVGSGMKLPATIIQTFPKGAALAKWLVNVGASTTQGEMMVDFPRDNLQGVNAMLARDWITVQNPNAPAGSDPTATEYMSFNTPLNVPEDQICGREVYTDLHVASVGVEETSALNAKGFPASCEQREMSAQEKAVAFMLFDLSACVQSESKPPKPPK